MRGANGVRLAEKRMTGVHLEQNRQVYSVEGVDAVNQSADHARLFQLFQEFLIEGRYVAPAAVQAMTAADLNRILVMCALASDLYCPGYNPKQSLAKDSNLARTAARYKVNSPKLMAGVRIELTSRTHSHRNE